MVPRNSLLAFLLPLAASLSLSAPSSAGSVSSRQKVSASSATSAPSVGSASSFAVLAGTAVTCTNATVTGHVGVYPGTAITQTSCPVTGTINAGNSVAAQAHNDFLTAYDQFKALACDRTLTTLAGLTLSPGVYCVDAAATSTGGVLTLDGPANGIWIFKIGTLGTGALTGTSFKVVTASGAAPPCNNVYWWVAEAVTMTDSQLVGTILAGAAITLTRGTFNGDAFAKAAATITGTAVTACALGDGSQICKEKCKCHCKCKHKHGDKDGHDDDDDDEDGHHGGGHHGGEHQKENGK
jgi:hypothetical protein